MTKVVSQNQIVIIEIVARVHAHVRGKLTAHGDFHVRVQQRDFDSLDLLPVRSNDAETVFGSLRVRC